MIKTSKNKKTKTKKKGAKFTISKDVPDYGNDPFFIKKAQESKEFLEKNGFPEELLKIRENYYNKR
jgi:hypothetical protein